MLRIGWNGEEKLNQLNIFVTASSMVTLWFDTTIQTQKSWHLLKLAKDIHVLIIMIWVFICHHHQVNIYICFGLIYDQVAVLSAN